MRIPHDKHSSIIAYVSILLAKVFIPAGMQSARTEIIL